MQTAVWKGGKRCTPLYYEDTNRYSLSICRRTKLEGEISELTVTVVAENMFSISMEARK